MKYVKLLLILFILIGIPGLIIWSPSIASTDASAQPDNPTIEATPLDFKALSAIYGDDIPVVVTFTRAIDSVTTDVILTTGMRFSFGNPDLSHVGDMYLLRGDYTSIETLMHTGLVESIDVQSSVDHIESTRDVSIPEINADDAWNVLDDLGLNLTGEGLLVADLDTGVDWKHPDLWFPGTTEYSWIDASSDSKPTNGSDYVDLDNDSIQDPNEILYYLDLDSDNTYNTTTDWLWVDNITYDGVPNIGEPFFVVNDTNGNDALDPGEKLIMLTTPKTRYIVEKDGSPQANIQVWQRGTNLTSSTHVDSDGHGTAVAGILLGGQLGFRKYVGVAPGAELMMIKVLGASSTALTVDEGLTWAYNHGADVILTEIGSWTYHYLDGSESTATLIDTIVSNGVPVISPSGNLGGKDKHALFTTAANSPRQVDFTIPPPDGTYVVYEISNVYITVLSINTTDFWSCNFSLIMNLGVWGGPIIPVYLHPGNGYLNFAAEPAVGWGGNSFTIESFISTSSRSTQMLGIWIHGTLPTTNAPPWHQLNVTTPSATTFHAYISDDQSSWTGGCVWKSDISDAYEITWPSTADSALSVASYRTRSIYNVPPDQVGGLASFSSRGPRIDEVLKQGVAAPGGYDIISDYTNASTWQSWYNGDGALPFRESFGGYRLFSGTSASGPHVAGCAALILQLDSTVGTSVASLIKNNARSDAFTGNVPNALWGYGKLDVFAAVSALDTTNPVIHSVSRSAVNVSYDQAMIFEANVTDNNALDKVYLKYQVNGWVSPTWVEMNLQPSGNYTVSLTASYGTVSYTVFANDTAGNSVETSVATYEVFDLTEPWLGNFWRSASTPGDGNPVDVRVDAVEPSGASGVDTVLLNWSVSGTWTVATMSATGDTYSATIPGQSEGAIVQYYFIANDTAGNLNVSSIFSYTVVAAESDPPIIDTPVYLPNNPTSADSVTVYVNVTDASGVDIVILSYFNGTDWVNVTMALVDGQYQGVIPAHPDGTTITFRIYARDAQGNWATSSDYSYTVSDSGTTTGTTTSTTNTTTTGSTTTTPELPNEPDPLLLSLMLGVVLALIIISIVVSRRRSQ